MSYTDTVLEYRLLGSMLDKPDTVLRYSRAMFTDERRVLFDAMVQAYNEYGDLSYEAVQKYLGTFVPQELEASRGAKPDPIVDKLHHLATNRELLRITDEIARAVASGESENRAKMDKILQLPPLMLSEVSGIESGVITFSDLLRRKLSGQYSFVSTGLPFLDHMLGGEWPRQAVTIISAESGGGKTALVVNGMLNMAQRGIASLCISLEMPRDRLVARMVANLASVDGLRIRAGTLTPEEQEAVTGAMRRITELSDYIHIVDINERNMRGLTVDDIVATIISYVERYNIRAFFVDYLQIVEMDVNVAVNETMALGRVLTRLRNTAIAHDLCGIVLSQKNRSAVGGLDSLFGSARIGHIADTSIEIALENVTGDTIRKCTVKFHKNRDGPVGESYCIYHPQYLRFE